ncbi:MAG: Ig-like domain-containing protein, partial [Chitinispirillia bacterium]
MMFPSKDSYAHGKKLELILRYRVFLFYLFILIPLIQAGEYSSSGFSNVVFNTNVLILGDSIRIAPKETTTISIMKDIPISSNSLYSSYSPEVVSFSGDTFSFFWNEFDESTHNLYQRKIILTETGYQMLDHTPLVLNCSDTIRYVHAESGISLDNTVVTFFKAPNMYAYFNGDSLQFNSFRYNSLCHISSNLFAVVYTQDNSNLNMRLVQISSGMLDFADGGTPGNIAINGSGFPEGYFSNSSCAADSSGNVLIMVTRGGPSESKYLEYILTDTGFAVNATAQVATNISLDNSGTFNYTDAPVISYADNKFASIFFKSNGLYLFTLECGGTPPAVIDTSFDLVYSDSAGANTVRSPTLAGNGKIILMTWKNSNGDLQGKKITVSNGVLSSIPGAVEVYSDMSTNIDTSGAELNAAVNSTGNFAVTWKQGTNAVASIWADKGIVYPTAQWVSTVGSISVIPGDSLIFIPGSIDSSLNKGSVTVYLQVGPSSDTSASGWSNWTEICTESDLTQNTKGILSFYRYKAEFVRPSVDSFETPVINDITLKWNIKPIISSLDSIRVNGVKISNFTGFNDTIDIISHSDIIDCYYTLHDGDTLDTLYTSVPWSPEPQAAMDTVIMTSTDIAGSLRLNPKSVWDTIYDCSFYANDNRNWNAENKKLTIRARKASPVITSVTFDGNAIANGGTKNVNLGKVSTVNVTIERSNTVDWNQINYRFITNLFDTSFSTASHLSFTPEEHDNFMQIIVTDAFAASDTFNLFLKYSKYTTDTLSNPDYYIAKKTLSDSLSYISGSSVMSKTVQFPIYNTGNDTLLIDSILFKGSNYGWLSLGIPQDTGLVYFDSLTSTKKIIPLAIPVNNTVNLNINLDIQNLSGDGMVYDTIYVWTNDPNFPVDTVPITLEYNDLPVIIGINFDFQAGIPYWMDQRIKSRGYYFPPHAKLELNFSEPMDSSSAVNKIFAYSIFDSTTNGKIDTIILSQTWLNNYRTLSLQPVYRKASTYFNGLQPPLQMFIPTDSIAVKIFSDLRDLATTPSSPNYLDVNQDFARDSSSDTTITLRVDSINFTLNKVIPSVLANNVSFDSPIILEFSSPVYNRSIDYSLFDNKTLIVKSRYNSMLDSTKQIAFDTIYVDTNRVVFVPAKRFFFGDSVYCYYRGVSARDSLGYPVDINSDGIPIGLFDSASRDDDFSWSFYVYDIVKQTVSPENGETNVSINTPVKLTFSSSIFPGTIDTALTGNRSLTVTSLYSEGTVIGFDSVVVDDNVATFYLDRRLFYFDSVSCIFNGFLTKDTTYFSIDMGTDTVMSTNIGLEWYFRVEELSIQSVQPDSGVTNAGVRDPIVMNFTGPVSPFIFDTTTDADSNRSFYFKTSYSAGRQMGISRIVFSHDSSTVTVFTQKAYYSYDSIFCEFIGFKKGYSYLTQMNLIPTDTVSPLFGNYSWYFLTGDDG